MDRLVAEAMERRVGDAPGLWVSVENGISRQRSGLLLVAGLMAVVVLCGVWWMGRGDDAPAWTSIDDERKANIAYMARADVQQKIADLTKGTFVVIVGGVHEARVPASYGG